jgi:hypothetical protein
MKLLTNNDKKVKNYLKLTGYKSLREAYKAALNLGFSGREFVEILRKEFQIDVRLVTIWKKVVMSQTYNAFIDTEGDALDNDELISIVEDHGEKAHSFEEDELSDDFTDGMITGIENKKIEPKRELYEITDN